MSQSLQPLLLQLSQLDTNEKREDFLLGILTPQEQEQLPKRLEIIKRLKKGQSQWQIAADLKVGVATVTRGSKELQKGRFEYVKE